MGVQQPSSGEQESPAFSGLAPSGLSRAERRVILEAAPPATPAQQSVTFDDLLSGTNFESGRDVLLPAATARLDALAARLRGKQKVRVQVIGHTDNQRIAAWLKPTFPTNQHLSEARALAVTAYLMRALDLPAAAFSASGKGESEAIASNATPQGMAQNRRTEIRAWYEEAVELPAVATAAPKRIETEV